MKRTKRVLIIAGIVVYSIVLVVTSVNRIKKLHENRELMQELKDIAKGKYNYRNMGKLVK